MLLCLQKALWICFLCLMAGLLVCAALAMQDILFVLALAAALAAIFFWAARHLAALQRPRALEWPLRAGYALFFVLLCVFGLLALPSPHSDLAAVYGSVPDVLDDFVLNGAYADYFIFYAPVFYTDAFAMFFLVAEAWLLFRFSQGGGLPAAAACGAVAGLGVLMKGTLAVPVVALAISICFMGGLAVKKRLAGLAVLLGALALCMAVPAWLVMHSGLVDFSRYDALGLPVETWMCMSVHGGGAYCQDCVDYARSFATMAARTEAMRARLAALYQSYSLPEFLRFSALKTATVWCDGSYEALLYLKWPLRANAFNAVFTGSCRGFWVWCNAYLVMLYGLNLADALASLRQKEWDVRFFLRLCVFGLFLYFFLMEAAARRALMVLPALLLGAVCTLWRMAGKEGAYAEQELEMEAV